MKFRKIPWIALIAGLAVVIRCIFLEDRSIQYDDAFTILLAQQNLGNIIGGTAADTMPPLFYFLLHFWMQIATGIAWYRLLSVILNLVSLYLVYRIVYLSAGETAAIVSAFLMAISPLQLFHAQDIRMYALLEVTQCGFLYCFTLIYKNYQQNQPTRFLIWAMAAVCGVAAMYSHNLAIFSLSIPFFFLLIKNEWLLLKRFVLLYGAIGIAFIPWLIFIPGQLSKIQTAFWTPRPGLLEILQSMMQWVTTLPLPAWAWGWGLGCSLFAFVIIILELRKVWKANPFIQWVACCAFLPPLMLLIVSYLMRPVFVTRGFITSGALFLALGGILIANGWKQKIGWVLSACFICGALIALPYQMTYEEFPRSPYKEACQFINTQVQAGELVIHDNKLSFFPCKVYFPDLAQTFIKDEPGSANDTLAHNTQEALQLFPMEDIQAASLNGEKIYFVIFQKAIDEYHESLNEDPPSMAWLKNNFKLEQDQLFNDLHVFSFSK